MTKAVLEAGSEEEAQRTAATVPSTALAVPASLHASLMARLDRLGPAKEIAQIGAVIGREFSHALLAAVSHKAEAELQSALDRLMAAGLLFRQGAPPHATYLFKHALVRRCVSVSFVHTRQKSFLQEMMEKSFCILTICAVSETWAETSGAHWLLGACLAGAALRSFESYAIFLKTSPVPTIATHCGRILQGCFSRIRGGGGGSCQGKSQDWSD
jgi:hypothetical protein